MKIYLIKYLKKKRKFENRKIKIKTNQNIKKYINNIMAEIKIKLNYVVNN